jgi:transcriptional regulator with XRE-family HTH domain
MSPPIPRSRLEPRDRGHRHPPSTTTWAGGPGASPPRLTATLGETIAAYRRRRRQAYRDAPWSQEELAFASGTDQAHISRIESNRQIPEYSTLARLCDALGLSPTERAYVLALAGYQVAAPLPDDHAVSTALERLAPLIDSYPYPVVLLDEGERHWYVNEITVTAWGACYGVGDRLAYLERMRGRRSVEVLFDPHTGAERQACWRHYYEDVDHVLTRIVAAFWRAWRVRLHDPEMQRIVALLLGSPEFIARWARLEHDQSELLFVDDYPYVITHPTLGRLRLHAWRTRVATDERFIVVHFTPTDSATSRMLARVHEANHALAGS